MKSLILRYPIAAFLLLNYFISWSFLYPSYQLILKHDGITPLALIGFIGAYGPSIAAIIVQYVIDKSKLKPLFRKLIQVRTNLPTLLLIILGPILLYVIAYLISTYAYSEVPEWNILTGIASIPTWFLLALPFGPLGEELGWRGFMLPKLLEKHSMIKSTVIVGLAWGIWHMASFTFPGAALPSFFEVSIWTIMLYCLNTIALSFVYSYVYLKTQGSVFYAILLHAFFNASSNITGDLLGESENISLQISAYILHILMAASLGILLLKRSKAI